MLQINVHTIGNRPPAWVTEGVEEYGKRLSGEIKLQWRHFKHKHVRGAQKLGIDNCKVSEKLLAAIPDGFKIVALDEQGEYWTSFQLAARLDEWSADNGRVCILIGGPNGLSSECLLRADQIWSLGPITLPHFLVRIILAEQLYRAVTINKGHPYHRE